MNPITGDTYNEADLLKEPKLAQTLDIIAAEGPDAMHNGSLTAAFVRDIESFGGIVSVEDMNNFR